MRNLILALTATAIGILTVTSASSSEIKLSHFMSPNHPFHGMIFEWWGNKVKDASNGDVTIRIFPAGELGAGPVEQYSRAVDGVTDVSFVVQGYTPGNPFPLSLIAEQPGAIREPLNTTAAMNRAQDLWKDEYRRVKLLSTWAMPPAVLFTRDMPVSSIDDVKGMKIRAGTKDASKLIEAWGATPIFMPVTEVYTAMQTGVVDAVLINASAAAGFKLTEVAKYMISGFDSLPAVFTLVMNRDAYDGLSDAQRKAVDTASGHVLNTQAGDVSNAITSASVERFLGTEGRSEIVLTAEQAAPFNDAAAGILEARMSELEADGLPARAVLAKMRGQ